MKKYLFVSVLAIALITSLLISMLDRSDIEPKSTNSNKNTAVLNVSDNGEKEFDNYCVLESRFLNMLNRNFVYGNDFNSVEDIVNSSMPALLQFRDKGDESFIKTSVVAGFIADMYGIKNYDLSEINSQFETKEGYIYIIPRGYSVYSHNITSITANEDGSFFVISAVTTSTREDDIINDSCKTLFVQNPESSFGYSIISCDIGGNKSVM